VLDWSYSNLCTLYDVGYAAGEKFYEENEPALRAAALDTTGVAKARPARATAGRRSAAEGPGA
jgi:hypothetical protein